MSRKRFIFVGIFLVVVAIFPLYRFLGATRGDDAAGPLQTARAEVRDLGETVLASGLVSPGSGGEKTLRAAAQGIVGEVFMDLGSQVEEGMLLLTLENSSVELRLEKAKGALRLAEIQLEELKKGPRPEEVARAEISLEQARETLNRAEERQEEYEGLLETVQGALDSLSEEEESLREELLAEEKKLDEQLAAAQRDVSNALTQYRLAKEQLSLTKNKISGADIEQAEIRVSQARLDVKEAEQALKSLEVYAPAGGLISALNAVPGDTVNSGTVLATILDMQNPIVTVYVDETDIPKVKSGLEAVVALDAFPMEEYEARVRHVSPAPRREGNIIYYEVTLEFFDAPQNLYPSMTADASIYMERLAGVLVVPSAAIRSSDGKTVVYRVQAEDSLEKVIVNTGIRSTGWVEIVEGIEAGEQVLTGNLPPEYR